MPTQAQGVGAALVLGSTGHLPAQAPPPQLSFPLLPLAPDFHLPTCVQAGPPVLKAPRPTDHPVPTTPSYILRLQRTTAFLLR